MLSGQPPSGSGCYGLLTDSFECFARQGCVRNEEFPQRALIPPCRRENLGMFRPQHEDHMRELMHERTGAHDGGDKVTRKWLGGVSVTGLEMRNRTDRCRRDDT